MDQRFKERQEQTALIEYYQDQIDLILMQNPDLVPLQREIEERLDKIGDIKTQEGRMNRSALALSMLRESFVKLAEGLDQYQKLVLKKLQED